MTREARATLAHPSDRMLWHLVSDGDLEREQRRGVERHLDSCPDCLERLQDLGTRGIAAELVAHGDTLHRRAPKALREMGLTGRVTRAHLARALVGLSIPYLIRSPEAPVYLPEGDPPEVGEQRAYVLSLLRRSKLGMPLAERVQAVAHACEQTVPGEPERGLDLAGTAVDIAVALDPGSALPMVYRGLVASGRGSFAEAEAWWIKARARTRDRNLAASMTGDLGTLAYCTRDLAAARRLQSQAMRSGGPYVELRARMSLAVVLVEQRAVAEARECIEGIDPNLAGVVANAGAMLNRYGEQLMRLVRRGGSWHAIVLQALSQGRGESHAG